jgi:hypothetical protein
MDLGRPRTGKVQIRFRCLSVRRRLARYCRGQGRPQSFNGRLSNATTKSLLLPMKLVLPWSSPVCGIPALKPPDGGRELITQPAALIASVVVLPLF